MLHLLSISANIALIIALIRNIMVTKDTNEWLSAVEEKLQELERRNNQHDNHS